MKRILSISFILIFLICLNDGFTQKSKQAKSENSESKMTEYDYYEKLRLERKEIKVRQIKAYEYVNDALWTIDSFDVDGYLRKREVYTYDLENSAEKIYSTIIIERYDEEGNMYGYSTMPVNINSPYNFDKVKPTYFYDIGINEETLVEEVKYIFDNNNLIEKRSYGDHLYGTGKEYESEYFYYDKNNKLIESKSPTGESSISITKYFYNGKGLLDKVESSYDFQNGNRVYGIRYEYEFYDLEDNSNSNTDPDFINFFNGFRTTVLNQDKTTLEFLTQWSEADGGIFSIDVKTKNDFMNNIYKKLFDNYWMNAIAVAELDKPVQSEFGQILLSKIDPVSFGFKTSDIVYILDNNGNALVFKQMDNEFRLISMMITSEGD